MLKVWQTSYSMFSVDMAGLKLYNLIRVENLLIVNSYLFKSTNIKHCVSSAYHPQTNGLDERFNQTLLNTLKKVVDSNEKEWDVGVVNPNRQ